MRKALIVVDVQNDFITGSLAVPDAVPTADRIVKFLKEARDEYSTVVLTMDSHTAHSTNGGHIALDGDEPDYVNTWPPHCIAGTEGWEPWPALRQEFRSLSFPQHFVVFKGQGEPAYSGFEGKAISGETLSKILASAKVDQVDIVGLATDYCVFQTAMDTPRRYRTVVYSDLMAGVDITRSLAAIEKMRQVGITICQSKNRLREYE